MGGAVLRTLGLDHEHALIQGREAPQLCLALRQGHVVDGPDSCDRVFSSFGSLDSLGGDESGEVHEDGGGFRDPPSHRRAAYMS